MEQSLAEPGHSRQSFSYFLSDLAFQNSSSPRATEMGAWSPSFYFYVILAVAQELGVDFLSITHQAALGKVGAGASGDVQQNLVNASYNVAFKRISQATVFLNELIILAYIRDLDNIVTLDGISWEVAVDGGVKPVLVFEKSPLGDLHDFMGTDAATQLSFLDRMTFCTQIAKAIRDLHRASKLSLKDCSINLTRFSFRNYSW
jgi:serine/threonine protein kinase